MLPRDLEDYAGDEGFAPLRTAAAGHPRLPLARLEALLLDDDRNVVEAAGASPVLPETVMVRLLDTAGL